MNRKNIELLDAFLCACLIAVILNFMFWPFSIDGSSMENTLTDGEYVIVSKILADKSCIKRGDLIICKLNNGKKDINIIKRVIGLPGDTIEIKDGNIILNNQLLNENYIKENFTLGEIKITLSENQLFILGDNRTISFDSRKIGPITYNDIKAKVLIRLFPITKINIF